MKTAWTLLTILPSVLAIPLSIDISIKIEDYPSHRGPSFSDNSHLSSIDTESKAPWGLARISHRPRLSFGSFNKYIYDSSGGEGTEVYVLGSGVNIEHEDFQGRARWGVTTVSGGVDEDTGGGGTHVAGTIAGLKYGVAKKAKIVAIKVTEADQFASTADVIKGIKWMISAHEKRMLQDSRSKGSVAVLAFEPLENTDAYTEALNSVTKAGIHLVLPSGDLNKESCPYSAINGDILVLGASTLSDERAYFSTFARCVDAYAPGLNILSAWKGASTDVQTLSGSVSAAAHGAGLVAYTLGLGAKGTTPAEIKEAILDMTTKFALDDLPGEANNRLLYNGVSSTDIVSTLDLLNQHP